MNGSDNAGYYVILFIGIVIFVIFPICALTNCLHCQKRQRRVYIEVP